jgi:hypothetical protein
MDMMIIIMSSQACLNVLLCQICAPDLLVSPENSRTLIFPKGKQKQTRILWPSCLSWELRNFDLTKRKATNKPGLYGFVKSIMKSGKHCRSLALSLPSSPRRPHMRFVSRLETLPNGDPFRTTIDLSISKTPIFGPSRLRSTFTL